MNYKYNSELDFWLVVIEYNKLTHCNSIDVNMIKTERPNVQYHGIKEQNIYSPGIMHSKYMPFPWFTIPECHPTSLRWFLQTS